jgi:CRISPR-associated protein Cas1
VIEQETGTTRIPIDDISILVTSGPNIRMSTQSQAILAERETCMLLLGKDHMPTAMTIPMVANARQARVTEAQATLSPDEKDALWQVIVRRKIANQATVLGILGLDGSRAVARMVCDVAPGDATGKEGAAARRYFQELSPGLNRRKEGPFNSALNYGYAIVRAAVARSLVTTGFVPAMGIHHHSQLNAFNLVDDVMEPLRPTVDLLAIQVASKESALTREQRERLREVLQAEVLLGGHRMSVLAVTQIMSETFRRAVAAREPQKMVLPTVLPCRIIPAVTE